MIDEALRMRSCPGIFFADEGDVREAKLAGTGLGVWEVVRDWLAAGKDEKKTRKALPSVSDAQLKAAILYYGRFADEIDAAIEENARLSEASVEKRFRGLLRGR